MVRGGFDGVGSNLRHAPVIGRAATQKTRAAVWFFLDDAGTRRNGSGPKRIGWSKDRDDRETDGRRYVHCAGVVANEQVALR